MSKEEKLKLAEMLSSLRNGLQTATEAIDAYLSYVGEIEAGEWNPNNIEWFPTEGPSGPYEKAVKQENRDYELLVKDLEEHKGFMQKGSFKYWLFDKADAIGRKSTKKA